MAGAYCFSNDCWCHFDLTDKSVMGDQDTIHGKEEKWGKSNYTSNDSFFSQTQNDKTPYRYNNTIHAFQTIAKEEGIRGFYKGLGPSLIGVSHVAVQFPLYEKLKAWFGKIVKKGKINW